jgi:protein TonB
MYSSCSEEVKNSTLVSVEEEATAKNSSETSKGVESTSIPFASVDKVPVFPGCENIEDARICFMNKVQEHIRKHFKYPEEAQLNNIQGRVFVQFTVKADGSIGSIRTRGPEKILEESARAILEKLPNMIPGEQNGTKVDVPFSIPISYVLR